MKSDAQALTGGLMAGADDSTTTEKDKRLNGDANEAETSHPWHALDVDHVARLLGTQPTGLSADEAAARLTRWGPNRIEDQPPPPAIVVILRQFTNPLILILVVAAGMTTALGRLLDTSLIVIALLLNAVIGFVQEQRAAGAVRALMRLVVPRSRVLRDGVELEVDSTELVPGDVVRLQPGSRVPADVRLVETTALAVDESLLTGESLPSTKQVTPVGAAALIPDQTSMAFTGTIVTSGRGSGYVVATGHHTQLGTIAGLVRAEEVTQAPLHSRLNAFSRVIGISVLIAAAVTFVSGLALGESVDHMFHVAVAMAVSAVPEGLPVAVTVTLAIGVTRMAKRNAVIRHLAAVETLGSATVVGSDKTGTLTENRMKVQSIWADSRVRPVNRELVASEPARLTLLAGVLTNEANVEAGPDHPVFSGDPTEVALYEAAHHVGVSHQVREEHPLLYDIPFEPERRWSASLRAYRGVPTVFLKGAPEDVIAICSHMLTEAGTVVPIDPAEAADAARGMAGDGQRVLAMAYLPMESEEAARRRLAEWATAVSTPRELTLLGLQGMFDPPRDGVREAIDTCHTARVRVIMITGDHAATAHAIGVRLGIINPDDPVVTGADLVDIDDSELRALVTRVSVFARMSPGDKLRIVCCLQDLNHIVAVTGDGANDAPALRAASIGIAMGRSGTDVAREASDIVLSDDNFVSIVAALEEGRVAFANIRKVSFFLISTALAETVAIMVSVWLGWPLLIVAAQILWLNLVTNGVQDLALAFEPGSPEVLKHPPRPRREGILSPTMWERTAVTGLVMAVGALVMFRWELDRSGSLVAARTVALTTLVIFNVFQVGNARSETRSLFALSPCGNRFLFVATVVALALHLTALHLPATRYVLGVEPIDLEAWRNIVLVATTILAASEAHKAVRRKWPMRPRSHEPGHIVA